MLHVRLVLNPWPSRDQPARAVSSAIIGIVMARAMPMVRRSLCYYPFHWRWHGNAQSTQKIRRKGKLT